MERYENKKSFEEIHEELLDQRIKTLETGAKRSEIIGKTSAAVAAVSILTIIGNLLTNDPNIALQSAGASVAMISYAVGHAKLNKYYDRLIDTTKQKKEHSPEITEISVKREKLESYKNSLAYYKLRYPTQLIAGIGFAEASIVSLINAVNAAGTDSSMSLITLVLGSSISALVAAGHAKIAKDSKSEIKRYQELINDKDETEKSTTLK